MADAKIDAIYSPTTGKVGCVLIQAAYRCSPSVSQMFDTADWDVAPTDTMVRLRAAPAEWQWLASLSRKERVQRWERFTEDARQPEPPDAD